jgi:hypothetical protein
MGNLICPGGKMSIKLYKQMQQRSFEMIVGFGVEWSNIAGMCKVTLQSYLYAIDIAYEIMSLEYINSLEEN